MAVQNDKHLGVLAGLLQGDSPVGVRSSVANTVRRVIADDHSTQWVLAEVTQHPSRLFGCTLWMVQMLCDGSRHCGA